MSTRPYLILPLFSELVGIESTFESSSSLSVRLNLADNVVEGLDHIYLKRSFSCIGPALLSTFDNWIVLMHRFDGSLDFYRNWTEYRNGFGDIGQGEFWFGNEKIHRLTNRTGLMYSLRIEVFKNRNISITNLN